MSRSQLFWLTCLGSLFVLICLFFIWKQVHFSRNTFTPGVSLSLPTVTNVLPRLPPIRSQDPVRGKVGGEAITIVEFADFSCLYCRLVQKEIARALKESTIPARLVWRDLPLSSNGSSIDTRAANVGRCANDQGKFWEMHDALFDGQAYDDNALPSLAQQLRLDIKPFLSCVKEEKYKKNIEADIELAKSSHISGTPTFFVGQEFFTGYITAEEIKAAIQRATKKT